jgi:hypothetical protein
MSATGTARAHKPSWATGAYYTRVLRVGNGPTQFEQLVAKRGLENRPDLWVYDTRLRAFARAQRSKRYVPESFLVALGLSTEEVDL